MAIQSNAADIHLRSSQALGLGSRSSFSITCWIRANWSEGGRRSFVGIYGPSTDTPLATPVTAVQIGTSGGNGELTFWTWGGGTLTGTATGFMTSRNNRWTFIAYTYDGITHRGYVDGVQVTSSTATQLDGFLNQVYINGYPTGGTGEVASFQLDSYRLFRRTLAADEILTMYNAEGSRHGIVNGIIASYEFDEQPAGNLVNSVVDLSGNSNTLTSIGPGAAMTYAYVDSLANTNIRPVQ